MSLKCRGGGSETRSSLFIVMALVSSPRVCLASRWRLSDRCNRESITAAASRSTCIYTRNITNNLGYFSVLAYRVRCALDGHASPLDKPFRIIMSNLQCQYIYNKTDLYTSSGGVYARVSYLYTLQCA